MKKKKLKKQLSKIEKKLAKAKAVIEHLKAQDERPTDEPVRPEVKVMAAG